MLEVLKGCGRNAGPQRRSDN